ncbi:MAG TPA: hypothetical protein PK867_24265, partial [Pirellulales bacterium]|nr:hypothetical protein [Pirellulales bacterium]
MFLSGRDLQWAIECGKLIFRPPPEKIDATSIDLHLDSIEHAKVWDIEKFSKRERAVGRNRPELRIGQYNLGDFGGEFLVAPPTYSPDPGQLVGRRGDQIVLKHSGFMLWQTFEV